MLTQSVKLWDLTTCQGHGRVWMAFSARCKFAQHLRQIAQLLSHLQSRTCCDGAERTRQLPCRLDVRSSWRTRMHLAMFLSPREPSLCTLHSATSSARAMRWHVAALSAVSLDWQQTVQSSCCSSPLPSTFLKCPVTERSPAFLQVCAGCFSASAKV